MTQSTEALYRAVGAFVGQAIRREVEPIIDRLLMLEGREPAKDGKDADPVLIARLVADAVSAIPKPQDGKSVTLDDVLPMIEQAVQRVALALPEPKDGIGLAGAVIDRAGSLIITLTDGSTRELGRVVGTDGKDAVAPVVPDIASIVADLVETAIAALPASEPTVKAEDRHAPDDVADLISKAAATLAQSPPFFTKPTIVSPQERRSNVKTITTRRDADGNLIARVVEDVA